MPLSPAGALALGLALGLGEAAAHDDIGSGALRPLVRDSALEGVWTTWGPVQRVDERWVRVCEEASPNTRDVAVRADGTLVFARAEGLATATDGGCTLQDGPIGQPVAQIAAVAGRWWAVLDGAEGDALVSSDDELRTFREEALPGGVDLRAIAEDGAGRWWGAGVAVSSGGPVVIGPTGEVPVPAPDAVAAVVLGAAPRGTGVVVGTVDALGRGTLWVGDEAGFAVLAELPVGATGWGCVDQRCAVALDRSAMVGFDRDAVAPIDTFDALDGPAACLMAAGGALWACGAPGATVQVARSTDGTSFEPVLSTTDIVDAPCGACVPLDTASSEPEPEPEPIELASRRCGCGLGAPTWGGIAMSAGWARRRRRKLPVVVEP